MADSDKDIEDNSPVKTKSSFEHMSNGNKQKEKEKNIAKLFRQDIPSMILLVLLYAFQGLPMGLFLKTIPILFKNYLSYQEIGVIMMASMPYSFKFFWAPVIEIYYL